MNVTTLKCPNCGSPIESNLNNRDFVFCSYCGTRLVVNDNTNRSEHTINKNVKIDATYNINKTETKIDKAEIIKNKNNGLFGIGLIILSLATLVFLYLMIRLSL